ncbi:MAG: twin-arginine translocation pathway signal [Herminiimonas sp.]|nr:twin-arginine translocation pathway signal [Herminiimonas sp.]MDB5852376.1 twin-arginine translocation pathway signal [Herminiimonas sp.]
MQRREFLAGIATATIGGLALSGCGTTSTASTTQGGDPAQRRREIDTNVDASLTRLYSSVPGSKELSAKAFGMLVFPSVIAAGLGIGGQYGEGVLRSKTASEGYYNLASLSVGLQIGAQSKMIAFLFMTQDALDKFRRSEGWSVGGDASVAVLRMGANGAIDVTTATGPVIAFVMTNAGLMANLTLEGTKVTRLKI